MKNFIPLTLFLALTFAGPLYVLLSGKLTLNQHWSNADRSSANLTPNSTKNHKAIVQIYAARAYNWRGMFAVHTWIVTKTSTAKKYTIYQVLGWNKFYNRPLLHVYQDAYADRNWFGHKPILLYEKTGTQAKKIIGEIDAAIKKYPYTNSYHVWPGPNSNTFVAFVIRHSASISVRLPLTALGKDYPAHKICFKALSKTGYQCSLHGLLGITLAKQEGLEINILGIAWSINGTFPYLHLPGID